MANKSLNDKYEIPFLSEWKHKDGGIYTVLVLKHLTLDRTYKIPVVLYSKNLTDEEKIHFRENRIMNQFVRTVEHFKSSFTHEKRVTFTA